MSKDTAHDTVRALAESDATGEIAGIFADIRHTMQIPILTSIWRILADSEKDLDSTWKAVKPLYPTGQPEAALARMRSEATFPELSPVSLSEIEEVGVSSEELRTIRMILAAYNRSNSLNLLTQTALVPDHPGEYVEYPVVETNLESCSLPRLLPREEISDSVWEVVLQVNAYGTRDKNPGLATIFRHLAYWPSLLSLMQSRLANAQEQGTISIGANSVAEIAVEEGRRMVQLRDEVALSKMSFYARETVTNYVKGPFKCARIVNIGTALSRWLEAIR
jgi:hypothetical protein